MGFSPINQVLTSPTPYPLEPCHFHSTLHWRSWLWFILFDVRVYMMPNYNVPNSTTYHRQLFPLPNLHNQIDGGDFSFISSPRLITIYTSCKWGQNWGHYIPLPLGITPSSVFHYIYIQYIYNCTSKFENCRSVPRSIIYVERSRLSPSASMDFSSWFSASS